MTRHDLTDATAQIGSPLAGDVPEALATRPLFWRARYVRPTDWVVHIPFAFWLMEVVRPRRIVELGIGSGTSYFAFCQAADKLGLNTRCMGVDHWQGDHFGKIEDDLIQSVNWYNETQFQEFSTLAIEDAVGAEARVPPGSVDLLHVDVELTRPVIDCLTHEWAARLSDRAIVLIHAPERQAAVSKDAAGFINRLKRRYRTLEMTQGAGLLVVLFGGNQREKLMRLAELTPDMAEHARVNETFQRLGDGYRAQTEAREENRRAARLRKDIATAKSDLTKAQEARDRYREGLETAQAALQSRTRKAAEAEARLYDRDRESDALTKLAEDRSSRIEALETALNAAEARATAQAEEITALKVAQAEAEAETTRAHQAELAEAEAAREDEARERADLARQLAEATAALSAAQAAKRAVEAQTAEAQAHHATELSALNTKAQAQAEAVRAAEAERDARFDELAELARHLETAQSEIATLTSELHATENARVMAEARARTAGAERDALATKADDPAPAKAKAEAKAQGEKARAALQKAKALEADLAVMQKTLETERRAAAAETQRLIDARKALSKAEKARAALEDSVTLTRAARTRAEAEADARVTALEAECADLRAALAAKPTAPAAPVPAPSDTPPATPSWRSKVFGKS